MKFHIQAPNGDVIISNLEAVCAKCLKNCDSHGKINYDCGLEGVPKRNGIITGKNTGSTFLCSNEAETKTTALFKQKIDILHYSLPAIEEIKREIKRTAAMEEHQRYKRLVHNLKTLNGQTIQELFNLVPQEYISANIREQFDLIKNTIEDNLDQTARVFIKIAKHNSHMKAEFAIQDKLMDESPVLSVMPHVIRKVLMNVLHTFFVDLEEIDVQTSVNVSYARAYVDYESIHVAFYHLILNAVKYIRHRSSLRISFSETLTHLSVNFDMESLFIRPDEVELIFQEGYSGHNPRVAGLAGEGIGMARIKSLVELNKGEFLVHPAKRAIHVDGLEWGQNVFTITLRKTRWI